MRLPRLVQSRVDTIEIGFDVIIATEKIASLITAKEEARRAAAGGRTVFMVGDEPFALQAKGAPGHPFVLGGDPIVTGEAWELRRSARRCSRHEEPEPSGGRASGHA